jgi:ActR/RegA family two-component response regulator
MDDAQRDEDRPRLLLVDDDQVFCLVLAECGGNISEAARRLRMHRRTLQRKLAKRPVRD